MTEGRNGSETAKARAAYDSVVDKTRKDACLGYGVTRIATQPLVIGLRIQRSNLFLSISPGSVLTFHSFYNNPDRSPSPPFERSEFLPLQAVSDGERLFISPDSECGVPFCLSLPQITKDTPPSIENQARFLQQTVRFLSIRGLELVGERGFVVAEESCPQSTLSTEIRAAALPVEGSRMLTLADIHQPETKERLEEQLAMPAVLFDLNSRHIFDSSSPVRRNSIAIR